MGPGAGLERRATYAKGTLGHLQARAAQLETLLRLAVVLAVVGLVELPDLDLLVPEVTDGSVEVRAVGAAEHHCEVAAFLPVGLAVEKLSLDLLEKLRARQRVGDAHAHIVRACCLQQLARCEDVGEFLVEVTELDEEAHPNAVRFQTRPRLLDLRHRGALVHGVQYALTAALSADPGLGAAGFGQRGRHVLAGEVGADLDGEGDARVGLAYRAREAPHPRRLETEDVVGEPDVIRVEALLEVGELGRHRLDAALRVLVAPDGLRAPAAAERAAARG